MAKGNTLMGYDVDEFFSAIMEYESAKFRANKCHKSLERLRAARLELMWAEDDLDEAFIAFKKRIGERG